MPLFQKSVLNKFIKSQDSAKIEAGYQRFSDIFLQKERQAEIRSMKEEEFQDGFLDDLFVNILGYIKRPNTGYNLVREKKNEADGKKADGAILKNDSPLAVIELKGTDTTDLDKVTTQGFGYKNNHKECVYVIISNFEKLRFFIHHAVDYIEFNLFTLSKEEFTTLWLCLHSDNLLDNIPAKIKAESVVKEEDITKNLYKDYSTFKQELWQDIVKLNPEGDPLQFYKKTQKLIDRLLFIFFAEDAGLLPPNSISRMVDRWKMLKEEDAYKPLYDIFKQFFGYINTGRSGKTPQDEIFAYNGGLMLEDEVLESIVVSDEVLLKHVSKLTTYDFSSEVDVNILGHIFENSLNDIEAVTAELEGQEIEKSKSKRKKDGVFYTPKYITKYIVDQTVGKLCDEKKVELNIIDEEYAKGRSNRKKETLRQLDENLQAYRKWLLNLTICDPACGSGAFLNQALEYLMEEHRYIDELESQLLGYSFIFPGVENHILEKNLFGVDINEESIEIAKLSLWLRTAKRGRKLTSLNNNIKCGNSLIDDPEVAGDKAFNWQQEFPTVFKEKNKLPFHITTAIHDSRTSERMIMYKARERRFEGTKPNREVFPMTKEEEELIAKTVADIAKEDHLNIAAFNLCRDHMHILLVCEEEEVPKIMHKIKGRTARACNALRLKGNTPTNTIKGIHPLDKTTEENSNTVKENTSTNTIKGINPLDESRTTPPTTLLKDGSTPFWTQKYGCKPITSIEQFWNTLNYIEKNKEKHNLPQNPKLEKIILGFVKTKDECFKPEYHGGFDVVLGNPPYGAKLDNKILNYLNNKYIKGGSETVISFTKLSYDLLLKSGGCFGFIIPKSFSFSSNYQAIRDFIFNDINEIIDCKKVWKEVLLEQIMLFFKKGSSASSFKSGILLNKRIEILGNISKNTFKEYGFYLNGISEKELLIAQKINVSKKYIKDIATNSRGGIFQKKIDSFGDTKVLGGAEIQREGVIGIKGFVNKSEIESDKKSFINKNSILVQRLIAHIENPIEHIKITACIPDDKSYAIVDTINQITFIKEFNSKVFWCLFNSKLINWYTYRFILAKAIRTMQFDNPITNRIPVPDSIPQQPFVEKADFLVKLYHELREQSQKFLNLLQSDFNLEKPSKKIEDFYTLSWTEFEKEMNKNKITLLGVQKEDWFDRFDRFKKQALDLTTQIDQTDKEIDRMVYALYGLTEEEIQIVENS